MDEFLAQDFPATCKICGANRVICSADYMYLGLTFWYETLCQTLCRPWVEKVLQEVRK